MLTSLIKQQTPISILVPRGEKSLDLVLGRVEIEFGGWRIEYIVYFGIYLYLSCIPRPNWPFH